MALLAGALAVTAVARRAGISAPLALVVVGLAVSSIPSVPDYEIDPNVVLLLILPSGMQWIGAAAIIAGVVLVRLGQVERPRSGTAAIASPNAVEGVPGA